MTKPPLKIGFVGLGFGASVAEALMSGAAAELFRLAAVCDADEKKVADFCARHPVKGYTSLGALLADDDIPTIALFTGPVGRAALLRTIVRAGKDVITTKPFELDPAAARSVLEEARQLGRTIHVNSPPAEPPAYLKRILTWQQEYSLGRAVSCHGEMLISYREKPDGRWLDDPLACPAAPIFRLGIYSLNDLARVFGPVRAVQVLSSRLFTGRPTADNAQLALLFENDAIGSIQASFCVDNGQHYANALTLNFERGSIYRNTAPVEYGQAGRSSRLLLVATQPDGRLVRAHWESSEVSGSYPWQSFHDAVTGAHRVELPVDEIVGAVAVLAAMGRAERSGRTEMVESLTIQVNRAP
ncbi:MAG TPA: Gfo/Idh/MocA family oxidoreductase [Opitutus sp.]|nr:Gfo/Idh/MocA family oxidoreductase [Opitutus sp.]